MLSGAAAFAQVQYTGDGTPAAVEEAIRWHMNRGRFDSASENAARGTAYTDVPASSGPLAPNNSLIQAARHHSEDMARNNVFQHQTVPGSTYYNATTQPEPWDRMLAEGYSWTLAAENIAAGYLDAESTYVGWWNSSGHRHNMYNAALREVGNGHFYWAPSTYQNYYTMDLGNADGKYFFTDTLFNDANGSGAYDEGEGIGNVAVRLLVGNAFQGSYDISTAVGSFAVLTPTIPAGAQVQVVLSNATAIAVSLSIPHSYSGYSTVTLAPGESRTYGTFTQPATLRNIGFRDVLPTAQTVLSISQSGQTVALSWPSEDQALYWVQWSADLTNWNDLNADYQPGSNGTMTAQDSIANGRRFYRVVVLR